jgi:hypothetical protein
MALRGYSVHARLVDENGPKLTPDDEMDDKVAHSLDPFLSRLSRSNVKPPNFVPAFRTYDEYGLPIRAPGRGGAGCVPAPEESPKTREDIASWYRNLTRTNVAAVLETERPEVAQVLTKKPPAPTSAPPTTQSINKKRKRGWFDSSVASVPLASALHPPTPVPTIADIVTRVSSPSQGEPSSASRNFSVIPPSNRGFSILSKSLGWQEGEGLGRSAKRRHTEWAHVVQSGVDTVPSAGITTETDQETEDGEEESNDEEECSSGEEDDIPVQLQDTQHDPNGRRLMPTAEHLNNHYTTCPQSNPTPPIDQGSRITPIPVVLKHDRLGVGASKKRTILTSNTLARLASDHERRNLSGGAIRHNETKARHRERREKFGRGRNSYARMQKQETKARERMLEYMNV